MCDMTHLYHDSYICETWLMREWDMTHAHLSKPLAFRILHVRHDTFICVTWLMCTSVWSRWHSAFFVSSMPRSRCICVTWLIHMWDMTHSHAWHDSFICVTWLIHMRDMTHLYVWHASFICVTCPAAAASVWHNSFICVTWLIHVCHMAH